MEDAGRCGPSALSRPVAIKAARILGLLQQRAFRDQTLPSLLVKCEGDHLQQQALDVCQWAMKRQAAEARDSLQRIASLLEQASSFFRGLAEQLSALPSTVVHGDFWSGNIAVAGKDIHFIDWGDALWGVGGVSLVNVIMTSSGQLDDVIFQLWEAYEQGWERSISRAYRQACLVASAVTDLVIDKAIATSCGQGPEHLPGLRDLEECITGTWSLGAGGERP
ncbi:MAG: phosphotransferase [Ktedonobacteraceae bacterium]|nr:phosphotransferase [Ktedonobacteraceae bacterium]